MDHASPASAPVPAAWRRRTLSALSATMTVLGLLLGTASIATGYAARTLADTDGFAATFAPLAQSPEV